MKLNSGFLPHCSYISKKLALHILMSRAGNNNCVFHTLKASGRAEVRDGKGKFVVNGVPFPTGTPDENEKKGALSCGCMIEEALLDFIFFKVAQAKSFNPNLMDRVDNMHQPLHPRDRTFLSQAFKKTGLSIDDLYVNDPAQFGSPQHMLFLMTKVLGSVNGHLPEEEQLELIDDV
jgi:hypothetical protein